MMDLIKKKVILLFLFTLLISFGYSQRWDHIFGESNTSESFKDIIVSYDQGYIISGYYEALQANWIFKTDINGNVLWEKFLTWDETKIYDGHIMQDKQGNLVIVSLIFNETVGMWPLVSKLDACGEKFWCRVFPNANYTYGYYTDILLLNNNNILALGYFADVNGVASDQVYLDYINQEGELLWRKAFAKKEDYPLIGAPIGTKIQKINNAYYINGYCYWAYPSNPGHYFMKPMFIGIDSLFNEKWLIPFGVNDSILGKSYDMIPINDSLLMGVGSFILSDGVSQNSMLMFFNTVGEELGYNLLKNDQIGPDITDNCIYDICRINDSLFMALSKFGNIDYEPHGEFVIDTAANLYKFQSWDKSAGGEQMAKTFDNNYIIGRGYLDDNNDWDILMYKIDENLESVPYNPAQLTYDSLCPYQITSGTVDISDCMVMVNTEETPTPEQYYADLKTIPIKAFPNPAKDMITFALENTDKHKNIRLECYDIFGRQVHKQKIYTGQLEAEANVSAWRSGMYVTVVRSNEKIVGKGKFVVE
jgi:Secretion system C-terminal sorting domain